MSLLYTRTIRLQWGIAVTDAALRSQEQFFTTLSDTKLLGQHETDMQSRRLRNEKLFAICKRQKMGSPAPGIFCTLRVG
jgi:hypothetical protein